MHNQSSHGEYSATAAVSQRLKSILKSQKSFPSYMTESIEMICSGLAAIACGDPYNSAHWHDIAGYANLVEAELNKPTDTEYKPRTVSAVLGSSKPIASSSHIVPNGGELARKKSIFGDDFPAIRTTEPVAEEYLLKMAEKAEDAVREELNNSIPETRYVY